MNSIPTSKGNDANTRLIAFYLPQFHPIPENDVWWGKGFTEWTNVTKAKQLFDGHYQPHLPTDFGFYDLRVRETRRDQIRTAKQYGIDGFCYHYYWFSGTRLLNQPLDDMLADAESDMPFCLCWANENWTRRWDAAEYKILIEQKYRPEDDLDFIKSLVPYFSDPRYIKCDGALLLIVYRPQQLPRPLETTSLWRDFCKKQGLGEIHLCAALTHGNMDYAALGFNSGVEFPPHNLSGVPCVNDQIAFNIPFRGRAFLYHDVATAYLFRRYKQKNVFRGVFPSWDNTARTGDRATLILNGTPGNYEYWLSESIRRTEDDFSGKKRFVFINAWNEWAEGCHLEPDRRYQCAFLEATARARAKQSVLHDFPDKGFQFDQSDASLVRDIQKVFSYHFLRFLQRSYEKVKPLVVRNPRVRKLLRRLFWWY